MRRSECQENTNGTRMWCVGCYLPTCKGKREKMKAEELHRRDRGCLLASPGAIRNKCPSLPPGSGRAPADWQSRSLCLLLGLSILPEPGSSSCSHSDFLSALHEDPSPLAFSHVPLPGSMDWIQWWDLISPASGLLQQAGCTRVENTEMWGNKRDFWAYMWSPYHMAHSLNPKLCII